MEPPCPTRERDGQQLATDAEPGPLRLRLVAGPVRRGRHEVVAPRLELVPAEPTPEAQAVPALLPLLPEAAVEPEVALTATPVLARRLAALAPHPAAAPPALDREANRRGLGEPEAHLRALSSGLELLAREAVAGEPGGLRVDRPGPRCRRGVGVAVAIPRPHVEGVRPVGEPDVERARSERRRIELALERPAGLAGVEREGGPLRLDAPAGPRADR